MSEEATEKAEHPEEQLRHMLGYIGAVRDALRMQNWNIILWRTVGENEDEHANTWQETNHTTLCIELGPGLFNEPPERIRNTIVHELTHAQHRDVTALWEGCTLENEDVPKAQAKAWDVDFHIFMERFVSWVARNISPSMPEYSTKRKYPDAVGVWLHGEHRE